MKFPGVECSHFVGVLISKGVEPPREVSNKNCYFHRAPLSSPEEHYVLGRGSSLDLEPPTLPLDGFQVEGLTPRKMVKV